MKAFLFILLFTSMNIYCQKNAILEVGDTVYNIIGKDEKGHGFELEDFLGDKYVLLNISFTACGPCYKVYPTMNDIQEKYGDKLKIISVHQDNDRVNYAKIAARMNGKFKGTTIWNVVEPEKTMEIYGIDGWPYFFLINKAGVIVDKWFGARKRKLRRVVQKWVK